ncbi:MAG: class I SAM-dependent methyltransferase [Bryobacteraceae bacterium]
MALRLRSRLKRGFSDRLRATADWIAPPLVQLPHPFLRFAPPGHFYSPIPDPQELSRRREEIFGRDRLQPAGIDLALTQQLALVEEWSAFASDFFPPASSEEAAASNVRFYRRNQFFEGFDAYAYYACLRSCRPRQVVEIGSGHSSALALDVAETFLEAAPQFTFIEPYPARLQSVLRPDDAARAQIIQAPVQEVDEAVFRALNPNDILVIDSSHVAKVGSDVNHIYLHVLPHLQPGVIIHIHDIFWPFEYPEAWYGEGRCWNEVYFVQALLMFNPHWRIIHFVSYLTQHHRNAFSRYPAWALESPGTSLWLKVAGDAP